MNRVYQESPSVFQEKLPDQAGNSGHSRKCAEITRFNMYGVNNVPSCGLLTLRLLRTWWMCFLETSGNRSYSGTSERSTSGPLSQKTGILRAGVVLLTVFWISRETGGLGKVYKAVDDSSLSDELMKVTR